MSPGLLGTTIHALYQHKVVDSQRNHLLGHCQPRSDHHLSHYAASKARVASHEVGHEEVSMCCKSVDCTNQGSVLT